MAKILVVDDDEGILEAIALILSDEGHTVSTITHGMETYTKVSTFTPDLILLDILMSGSDGRVICNTLKHDPDTKHIPIIMISAHPAADAISKKAGANDFLAKPFGVRDLLKKVKKFS
jgi:CheY-like chemotaxis protein